MQKKINPLFLLIVPIYIISILTLELIIGLGPGNNNLWDKVNLISKKTDI